MSKLKYQMAKYQEKINKFRMLRADISEKVIVDEVQKIASNYPISTITVLDTAIALVIGDRI